MTASPRAKKLQIDFDGSLYLLGEVLADLRFLDINPQDRSRATNPLRRSIKIIARAAEAGELNLRSARTVIRNLAETAEVCGSLGVTAPPAIIARVLRGIHATWPANIDWPADFPHPESMPDRPAPEAPEAPEPRAGA